ncbi:hypothetical protein Sme01_11250 [Sphaerisporangium melleum]|uniref:Uncharacterized protein n=1 Tax=Sphaerisporangium melleum TaxID=321316 RepID=A0A917QT33_9ACTN|nr:hypothetical protein GCM10007964_06370 [Sphaerisporangium melleum]GII68649.1 hypothetical protein Sme01_11250 [Sphaerisporangium melleum]
MWVVVAVGISPMRVVSGEQHRVEERGRGLRAHLEPADLGGVLGGLGVGVAQGVGRGRHDLQVVVGAPVAGQPSFDVGVERAAVLQGAVPAEDHVRRAGGELAALVGVARLDDHRVPLRRARHVEATSDGEVTPRVLHLAHGGGPGEHAGLLVALHRVGLPGVPQFAGEPDELGRARVTVGPVQVAAPAEVLPGEGVGGGDHVPGGAPRAEVVQGGQPPGHPHKQ